MSTPSDVAARLAELRAVHATTLCELERLKAERGALMAQSPVAPESRTGFREGLVVGVILGVVSMCLLCVVFSGGSV